MKIIVGLTGASGVEMGYDLIPALKHHSDCEVHTVLTEDVTETLRLGCWRPLAVLGAGAAPCHCGSDPSAVVGIGSF